MLWDLHEGKPLYTLDSGDNINALCFSPNRYWLCAATGPSIKIWVRHGNTHIHTHTLMPLCFSCDEMGEAMMETFICQLYFCDDKEAVSEPSLPKQDQYLNMFTLH